ncbi:hypothetical protein [Mycoplasmopsis caviae]|nr:hypothetical protein [Mycoplasmopsis caviae]VDR42504.1 Uncharacterised protein [Mycoplasmopsis caviae]
MTAPLNYALVDDENRYAQLKKWLVPSNVEDAKEAFLSLFYKPSNQHIMYVDRLAPMVVNNYQRDIKKFDNLLNNQILNREYLLNVVKPLFMNDDEYAIIYSRDDKYLMVEQIKMIERDKDVKTYLLTECGHATFSDKWKEVYNIVIQRINELENEAK